MARDERDYPYTDEVGTTWLDPSTIQSENEGRCFWCGRMTDRVDINYAAFFCGSALDRAGIDYDLRKRAGEYEGEYTDDLSRWNGEGGRV